MHGSQSGTEKATILWKWLMEHIIVKQRTRKDKKDEKEEEEEEKEEKEEEEEEERKKDEKVINLYPT